MWIDNLLSKNILVLDIETTVQWYQKEGYTKWNIDGSPFNPKNKLVSVNWRKISGGELQEDNSGVYYHTERLEPDTPKALQDVLDWADVVIAHNAKFDAMWLLEVGFKLPSHIYCTMVGEYILARGVRTKLSLKDTAIRRNVTRKKSTLVEEYFDKRIGYEHMPLEIVLEYGAADVLSCAEIFLDQVEDYSEETNKGLQPVLEMMNDMLDTIVQIERNGICIDRDRLAEIGEEYKAEFNTLTSDLHLLAREVLGDTPFNLNSGEDLSRVVYSRVPLNKKLHAATFNIGVDANGKSLYRPRMSANKFSKAYHTTTQLCYKQVAHQCNACYGKGWIHKRKKDGTFYKNTNKCKQCKARGFMLINSKQVAGFQMMPTGPEDVSVHGFSVDKATIEKLLLRAKADNNTKAVEFLTKHSRRNKVSVYLNTFVNGILENIRPDGLLHTTLNQCTTKTARLSSTGPNFQNQPRSNTFPIRGAIKSRFDGGNILEADYSSLEFVIAAELSQDSRAIKRILAKEDEHKQTASIILQKPQEDITKLERTSAKPYTFKPLYGGTGYMQPEHIAKYLNTYLTDIYPEIGVWHKKLMQQALETGIIKIPSGREYKFLYVKRLSNGKVSHATQIVNYPVQGFATGDIVPLACIRVQNALKVHKLKSLLILTVHDSVLLDVYPGEEHIVVNLVEEALTEVYKDIQHRFGYKMTLPLRIEQGLGSNWLDLTPINPVPLPHNTKNEVYISQDVYDVLKENEWI